jgi:LysR family transcriptional regulator of gallate degradation
MKTSLRHLRIVLAVEETGSVTHAAALCHVSQPAVSAALAQIEAALDTPLFDRGRGGLTPTPAGQAMALRLRRALAVLDQAEADVGALAGREVGRVVIGAMPLSRATLLAPAIALFRNRWKTLPVRVIDGPYEELVLSLRRGEIDLLVGALRPEVADLKQVLLFHDEMAIVARPDHPLSYGNPGPADLVDYPWIVAAEGTPARDHFNAMFHKAKVAPPCSLIETGSTALVGDLVRRSDHLGFVSARQIAAELDGGRLIRLPFQPEGTSRPIGLTTRADWRPTQAQSDMLEALRRAAV